VLTSLDRPALQADLGIASNVEGHVLRLATLAREAGLDGCVASPQEVGLLRTSLGGRWIIMAPGIRPAGPSDDQKRTATPAAAVAAGADYIVVGRPITAAPDPATAARRITDELIGAA
jgi:orotidine-5'-phosphate decarboxylase